MLKVGMSSWIWTAPSCSMKSIIFLIDTRFFSHKYFLGNLKLVCFVLTAQPKKGWLRAKSHRTGPRLGLWALPFSSQAFANQVWERLSKAYDISTGICLLSSLQQIIHITPNNITPCQMLSKDFNQETIWKQKLLELMHALRHCIRL